MENHGEDSNNSENQSSEISIEPVRSRWTPKAEQILILESIFNSGMVNPPKDETVRIRKLLEKFGSVGDANVFYWFQNRRSRSRRRQRQIQAAARIEHTNPLSLNFDPSSFSPATFLAGDGSSSAGAGDITGLPVTGEMGFQQIEQNSSVMAMASSFCPSDTSNTHFQSGYSIIFINGVPTEVPKGGVDMKAMFGNDAVLVDSCGVPVLTNEFGFSVQSLQHGENYFLVSRPT